MTGKQKRLRHILLKHAAEIRSKYEFPWLDQMPLSRENANKFFLGAIMDYQIDANIAWDNAQELSETVGAENLWQRIVDMPEEKWLCLRKRNGGYFHRFWEAQGQRSIARRIRRIAENIVHRFGSDVRHIWQDRSAEEVYKVLKNDVRVNLSASDATINMIVGALISYKHLKGIGDVKADMHVQSVLGQVFDRDLNAESAKDLAREIHSDNPWELDIALYDIGKKYCRWLRCEACPVRPECQGAQAQ